MYSKLFEAIYLECNSGSGVSNDFDTELEKPLESEKLFEKILFECNLKSLFKRTLLEALVNNTPNEAKERLMKIYDVDKYEDKYKDLFQDGVVPDKGKIEKFDFEKEMSPKTNTDGTRETISQRSVNENNEDVGIFGYWKFTPKVGQPQIHGIKIFSYPPYDGNNTLLKDAVSAIINFFHKDDVESVQWEMRTTNRTYPMYQALCETPGGNEP
jgi:hypothetical protein